MVLPPPDFESIPEALDLGWQTDVTKVSAPTYISTHVALEVYVSWFNMSNPATDLPLINGVTAFQLAA